MYQVVMRTDIDDLLTVTSPATKEIPSNGELTRDKTMNINDNEYSDDSMNLYSSKRISLKSGDEDNIVKNHEEERMKKDESSATLWMEDETENCEVHVDNMNDNYDNSEMSISKDYSMSSVYNFGYDSSFCKNDTTITEQEDPTTSEISDEFSYHFEELFNESIIIDNTEPEDENVTEVDLLDDFLNKSFTSNPSGNPSSRRNSMLSICSLINDYSCEDGGNVRNVNNNGNNNMETRSSCSRRNSRYSLNLSIHSMPCLNANGTDDHSNHNNHCGCNCTRYNNYSDNLLYVFPSPTSSPTLLTPPASPTFLLNDHDYIPSENPNTSGKGSHTPEMSEDDYSHHNSSFMSLNDSCCQQPSPILTSPTTSNHPNNSHVYRQFSPELVSPSPIVQSLSLDNICVNSYGYTCTFNHVNSTPTIQTTQTISNQHHRDN